MTKAVVLVVRDEEFYIDMALHSVAPYVDEVFVLDTGSVDKTISIIEELKFLYSNITLEEKFFGGKFRFGIISSSDRDPGLGGFDYKEKDARNYAIDRTIFLFNPDWIIVLDADEVFSITYWGILDSIMNKHLTLGHPTDILLSPYFRLGGKIRDPHVRAWSTKLNVHFNQTFGRHVFLQIDGHSEDLPAYFFSHEHVHFHLHYSFGPKSIAEYMVGFSNFGSNPAAELGIPPEHILNQDYYISKFSNWFDNGRFVNPSSNYDLIVAKFGVEKVISPLPNFVVNKWSSWGEWYEG